MVANRHRVATYHNNSTADELFGGTINILNDLERPPPTKK